MYVCMYVSLNVAAKREPPRQISALWAWPVLRLRSGGGTPTWAALKIGPTARSNKSLRSCPSRWVLKRGYTDRGVRFVRLVDLIFGVLMRR